MKKEWNMVFVVQTTYILFTLLTFFNLRLGQEISLDMSTVVIPFINLVFTFFLVIFSLISAQISGSPISTFDAINLSIACIATTFSTGVPVSLVSTLMKKDGEILASAISTSVTALSLTLTGIFIAIIARKCNLSRPKLILSFLAEGVLIFIPMYFLR